MRRIESSLSGVCILEPDIFRDARGYFFESYHQKKFKELGITDQFVQDNHSCSLQSVLRGLHYQLKRPQAKLCRVAVGEVLDVAIDIRLGSPTFGRWTSVVLSAENHRLIYIPPYFAHGFVVLSSSAEFLYKCSDFYDSTDDRGIAWNDPDLNIAWGIQTPLVSEKDRKLPRLSELPTDLLPVYEAS